MASTICSSRPEVSPPTDRPSTVSAKSASVAWIESPATHQGLTLVHFSAQRKHILWDTLGA